MGWEWGVPSDIGFAKSYGLGPEESYVDKQQGCRVGVFESSLIDLKTQYEVPQEHGNHHRTKWAFVSANSMASGLFVHMQTSETGIPFGFKVSNEKDLEDAKHPYETNRGDTILRVDYKQHGLESAAC